MVLLGELALSRSGDGACFDLGGKGATIRENRGVDEPCTDT